MLHPIGILRTIAPVLAFLALDPLSADAIAQEWPQPPAAPSAPAWRPATPPDSSKQLVTMRTAADTTRIAPGEKFLLAFIFTIEPEWHIYWENPGTSGSPTEIDVKVPPGWTVGRTLFPRPEAIETSEGITYGYEGQTVLFVEVNPSLEAPAQVSFSANAQWLVCKEICKMGRASGSITLPFGKPTALPGAIDESVDPLVGEFKKRLPRPLRDVTGAEARFDGTSLFVSVPAQKFETARFFPGVTPGVEYGEATIEKAGAYLHITMPVEVEPQNALGKPLRIAGVVGLGESPKDPSFEFEIPLTDDGRPVGN